jgi:hypothetical protein
VNRQIVATAGVLTKAAEKVAEAAAAVRAP